MKRILNEARYIPGSRLYENIDMHIPAEQEPPPQADLERIVYATYQGTGCVDLRHLNGMLYVIDVNPHPDIDPQTAMTYAAAEIGYSCGEMGSRIISLAAARQQNMLTMPKRGRV